jgi:hypothetical protein
LHRAVDVLQHGCFSCLGKSVRFAHDRHHLFLWLHGRPLIGQCPLDVSLR